MAEAAHRIAYPRLAVLPGGEAAGERMAAVVDLGSNSWRLVVYAYLPGASWRRVGQLQEPVRIAEGLSRSGALRPDAMARGLEALEMFGRYLQARGVERAAVDVVATSAIRDAAPPRTATSSGRCRSTSSPRCARPARRSPTW